MIDSHSHILPGMDDGSKSVEQSISMLQMEIANGIHRVVLTPHFYAWQNSPQQFLKRRQAAWESLEPALTDELPQLIMGAEVQYFEGICAVKDLHDLCIEGTDLFMLEMPQQRWSNRIIQDVVNLQNRDDMTVVLAHIERFLNCTQKITWDYLRRCGVLMQVNASFLQGFFSRHSAKKMMQRGEIHFLGSDAHDLTDRSPNLTPAMAHGECLAGEKLLEQAFDEY